MHQIYASSLSHTQYVDPIRLWGLYNVRRMMHISNVGDKCCLLNNSTNRSKLFLALSDWSVLFLAFPERSTLLLDFSLLSVLLLDFSLWSALSLDFSLCPVLGLDFSLSSVLALDFWSVVLSDCSDNCSVLCSETNWGRGSFSMADTNFLRCFKYSG